MVSAGALQQAYGGQDDSGKRMAPGLLIGCHIDTSTGVMSFTVNGKDVANKFRVEPGAMLFPAVFCEPTNKEMYQFELGRVKVNPYDSLVFRLNNSMASYQICFHICMYHGIRGLRLPSLCRQQTEFENCFKFRNLL